MTKKESLFYLLNAFESGKYNVSAFCEAFNDIWDGIYSYDDESNGISELEKTEFEKLNIVTERFSPFDDDIKDYPGVYFSENDVKNAIYKTISNLKNSQPNTVDYNEKRN